VLLESQLLVSPIWAQLDTADQVAAMKLELLLPKRRLAAIIRIAGEGICHWRR
jgi:hypothetical protein